MKNNWSDILRSHKLKATPGRLDFLNALEKALKPLSVERLREMLKVDLATVYRIIEATKAAGLIREIDMRHGHAHYEIKGADDHHHAICLSCDTVVEFEYPEDEKVVAYAQKATGFAAITDHTMEMYGYCQKCKKKA